MKAVVFNKYGAPDVLQIKDVTKPIVKPNQVLVKVLASSVTVADLRIRSASPFLIRLLYGVIRPGKTNILGFELSGEVVECGDDVENFIPGDRVLAYCNDRFGGYGEFIALDEESSIIRMPEKWSHTEAAVTPVAGVTVVRFLEKANIGKGERILIHGASGSVGSFAVQCSKFLGANVTATCSEGKASFVKELGADEVIDYQTLRFSDMEEGFDVVINNVPHIGKRKFKNVLTPESRYVSVWEQIKPTKADMEALVDLSEKGAFKPVVDKVFPVSQIQEAHRYAESKKKKGNIAIEMAW